MLGFSLQDHLPEATVRFRMTKEKALGKSLVEDLACLKKNIAMGYVKSGSQKAGTKFKIVI